MDHVERLRRSGPRRGELHRRGTLERHAAPIAGNTFTLQQQGPECRNSIDPASQSTGPAAADVVVAVNAAAGCTWTAASQAPWIAITEERTRTGSGSVRLRVEANSGAARTATLTIAGQAFTLTQQAGCTASIKPTCYDAGRGPDDIRISVTAEAGCPWTATSSVSWVTVAEGRSGTGHGTVRLLVEANSDDARAATLTIAGQPFTLRQGGRRD